MQLMNEPVDNDQKPTGYKNKETYYQRMEKRIENPPNDACRAVSDEIEDFKIFDPQATGNR